MPPSKQPHYLRGSPKQRTIWTQQKALGANSAWHGSSSKHCSTALRRLMNSCSSRQYTRSETYMHDWGILIKHKVHGCRYVRPYLWLGLISANSARSIRLSRGVRLMHYYTIRDPPRRLFGILTKLKKLRGYFHGRHQTFSVQKIADSQFC